MTGTWPGDVAGLKRGGSARAMLESEPVSLDTMAPPRPVTIADVLATLERLGPHLRVTPLHRYSLLDAHFGGGTLLLVKHEDHPPTGSFKGEERITDVTRRLRDSL